MSSIKLVIGSIILILISTSCSVDKWEKKVISQGEFTEYDIRFFDNDFGVIKNLKSTKLNLTKWVQNPSRILFLDSNLILADETEKTLFRIFDLRNSNNRFRTGTKGFGPNEIMTSNYTLNTKTPSSSTFWTYDLRQRRLSAYSLTDTIKLATKQVVFKNPDFNAFKVVWGSSNTLFGISANPKGRIFKYDLDGNVIKSFGNYSQYQSKNPKVSLPVIAQLHQGLLLSNGSKILKASINIDRLDLLDLEAKTFIKFSGPDHISPVFSEQTIQGNPTLVLDKNQNYYTFWDAYLTKNKIYLLYSGKKWEGSPIGKYFCDLIYVFDNKGNPLEKIKLDQEITSFTVDEHNQKIYAISATENIDILKFDLNNIM